MLWELRLRLSFAHFLSGFTLLECSGINNGMHAFHPLFGCLTSPGPTEHDCFSLLRCDRSFCSKQKPESVV